MEAQSYTAQERRAANQVWAAAGAYGFEPLFLAHNTDGTVDFYMNTIVGLVHKYYGDKLINSIFDRWAGDLRQAMLDALRLIRDVIAARIPAKLDAAKLFA